MSYTFSYDSMEPEKRPESPVAYIGIIDDFGRRLYSGNITWLREYIQNSIDSGARTINISLKDNDLEILDDGKGMDREELITQAFSIGKSFKSAKEIGELGVGFFAGTGTCDKVVVLTKKEDGEVLEASLDMVKFREINRKKESTTFEDGMKQILDIRRAQDTEISNVSKHFTIIRFENLNRDTLNLIGKEDLAVFIENTVDLPINENFSHKKELEGFLGKETLHIKVTLTQGGETRELKKFSPSTIKFSDTFWAKNIESNGKVVGKIWAVYNKEGESFYGNGIRVKRKGLTVGDPKYVESKFHAKYSERFYGEIIVLDDSIEINTSRDWFLASESLDNFAEKTQELLNELWRIADFDSRQGIGILNLINANRALEAQAEINEEEGNRGLASSKRSKIEKNEEKIKIKIQQALNFKSSVEEGRVDLSDPTNKLKNELIDRTISSPKVQSFLSATGPVVPTQRRRKSPFPEIVRTFLKENIINKDLAHKIGDGDVKDTANRAFTFIELRLKGKIGKKENEHVEWKDLIKSFKSQYEPPDYEGFPKDDHIEAFNNIFNGFYTILRNPSAHTFMENEDNPRNLFQVILIADFLVSWIDQWNKKVP